MNLPHLRNSHRRRNMDVPSDIEIWLVRRQLNVEKIVRKLQPMFDFGDTSDFRSIFNFAVIYYFEITLAIFQSIVDIMGDFSINFWHHINLAGTSCVHCHDLNHSLSVSVSTKSTDKTKINRTYNFWSQMFTYSNSKWLFESVRLMVSEI